MLQRISAFSLNKKENHYFTFSLQQVTITTRQLLCHKSGIRHYELKDPNKVKIKDHEGKKDPGKVADNITLSSVKGNKCKGEGKDASEDVSKSSNLKTSKTDQGEKKESETSADRNKCNDAEEKRKEINDVLASQMNKKKILKKKKEEEENEFDMEEYYIKEKFDTVKEALELFQKDELFFKPGK